MNTIAVRTTSKTQWIDITAQVHEQVNLSGVKNGLAVVYVPHTTAGITINEHADPAVVQDINEKLSELVPDNGPYSHLEGNSAGHIKASLMGSSQSVIIKDSRLQLGTWQGIFFCELDGPRSRQVYVKVISESDD